MSGTEPLLAVDDLSVEGRLVSGVSFAIAPGEVIGLVGESGAGKTTIGRAVLGLVPVHSGSIVFGGQDITRAPRRIRRTLGSQIQVVFQDPYGSLNPAVTVGASLLEALPAGTSRAAGRERMAELLTEVGLPGSAAAEYPGRFSGGQRQRIAIARALMAQPKLVICDEPVSALDVSIQAQVLNLLRSLRDRLSLSYLFIGHDLDVVRFMSDRILVLYRGRVMEEGPAQLVATQPRHPYTQALVGSAPAVEAALNGHRPPVLTRPAPKFARSDAGCPFADRCPHVTGICRSQTPVLTDGVACHRYVPGRGDAFLPKNQRRDRSGAAGRRLLIWWRLRVRRVRLGRVRRRVSRRRPVRNADDRVQLRDADSGPGHVG